MKSSPQQVVSSAKEAAVARCAACGAAAGNGAAYCVECGAQPDTAGVMSVAIPAGFWVRAGAFVVDCVLILALQFVTGVVVGLVALSTGTAITTEEADPIGVILGAAIVLGYFTGFTAAGRTPGKKLFDLEVVRVDGSRLTPARAFCRTLAYAVSSLFWGLGFVWAGFDRRKQAWHDKLCGTLVVRSARRAPAVHAAPRPALGGGGAEAESGRAEHAQPAALGATARAAVLAVFLVSAGVPLSSLAQGSQPAGRLASSASTVTPSNGLPDGECYAATGEVVAVPMRVGRPCRLATAEVWVEIQPSLGGPVVTVRLGPLFEVAPKYPGLRIGRQVALHCSEPTLEFLDGSPGDVE